MYNSCVQTFKLYFIMLTGLSLRNTRNKTANPACKGAFDAFPDASRTWFLSSFADARAWVSRVLELVELASSEPGMPYWWGRSIYWPVQSYANNVGILGYNTGLFVDIDCQALLDQVDTITPHGVLGIMEFRAAVFPHGLAEVSKIGECRNHPCTGLWIFVERGRNLVGILE